MAEKRPLCHYSGTVQELNAGDTLPGAGGDVAASINAADGKTPLADADKFGVVDTEASNVLKSHTWANLKAGIKSYLDSLTNWVSNAMLRNSAPLSVIGRNENSEGAPADMVAGSPGHVLSMRADGQSIGWGWIDAIHLNANAVETAKIKDENVTYAKLQHMTAQSVLARAAGTAGDPADVALTEQTVLGRITGGNVAALTATQVRTLLGLNAVTITRKTANQTWNSNTALAAVTNLSVAVAANTNYLIEFVLAVSAEATPDISFDITGPASPTAVFYGVTSGAGLFGGANAFSTRIDCAQGALVYETVLVTCFLTNGANAGTVQLRAAQRYSNAAATTVHRGSIIRTTVL